MLNSTPRVSCLIAAYLKRENPDEIVESFHSVDYPNKELLLAIGGAHKVADFAHLAAPDVILIEHPGGRKNFAYRRCLEKATGEILFLTDADCHLSSDNWLRLIAPIVNGEEQVTTGGRHAQAGYKRPLFLDLQHPVPPGANQGMVRYSGRRFSGRNSALTRAALDAVGGFNVDVLSEDYYLGLTLERHGFRTRIVDAPVTVVEDARALPYLRQQVRWIRALLVDGPRLRRYSEVLGTLRICLTGCLLIALTLALPFAGIKGALILLPLLTYAYLTRLRLVLNAAPTRGVERGPLVFAVPLLFAYVESYIGARALIEYLIPPLRRRW